jgi:hypothetical protein
MARKKSTKTAAKMFATEADAILAFLTRLSPDATDADRSWMHDYAIIRLYREFESLILDALVGAINNDTTTISGTSGVKFPKHLTDEVCEYLVTGGGYFDFKGRDGLVKTLKRFVPSTHYLVLAVKKDAYKDALEQLCALRNYAAHDSETSKRTARTTTGQERLGSAGSWLKTMGSKTSRMEALVAVLKNLAKEVETAAPY